MPLAHSDVARVQAVLDVVDGKLADPPRSSRIKPRFQRVAVLAAAAMVLAFSQIAVAFVALLALLKPSLPLLAGAGLAAVTAAGLVLRDHTSTTYLIEMSLPLAAIGLMLIGLAWGTVTTIAAGRSRSSH